MWRSRCARLPADDGHVLEAVGEESASEHGRHAQSASRFAIAAPTKFCARRVCEDSVKKLARDQIHDRLSAWRAASNDGMSSRATFAHSAIAPRQRLINGGGVRVARFRQNAVRRRLHPESADGCQGEKAYGEKRLGRSLGDSGQRRESPGAAGVVEIPAKQLEVGQRVFSVAVQIAEIVSLCRRSTGERDVVTRKKRRVVADFHGAVEI